MHKSVFLAYPLPCLVLAVLVFLGYSKLPVEVDPPVAAEDVLRQDVQEGFSEGDFGPVFDGARVHRYWRQVDAAREERRTVARGIYVNAPVAGSYRLGPILDLIERTELNAVVVDVKDDRGKVTYRSSLEIVNRIGSAAPYIEDMEELLRLLRSKGIYPIARIVAFKDSVLGKARPDLAIKDRSQEPWRDSIGSIWVNPYKHEVWEYNLAIAKEAARLGFAEIQFDYVRFPSDGVLSGIVYGPDVEHATRLEAIRGFLRYARRELAPYKVFISADVFGLVTTALDDMGIGQRWEEIAAEVDYISPMVYPSHYRPGSYGLDDPDARPYDTVYRAMTDARKRTPARDPIIRPWLQDFSLRHRYGPEDVSSQIQAVYDAGLEEWLLWNPYSFYTEGALRPARGPEGGSPRTTVE